MTNTSYDELGDFFKNLEIVQEEYIIPKDCSDISVFLEDPIGYLDVTYRELSFNSENVLYTEVLKTDGSLFTSIMRACNELVKVNAFTEAIMIYNHMIDVLEKLLKSLGEEDVKNVQWSIDELKSSLLNTMQMRDEYSSKRKSIIAKYSDLVSKMN